MASLLVGRCSRSRGLSHAWRSVALQRRYIAVHTHSQHASSLSVLQTAVDTSTAEFKENSTRMNELLASLEELHGKIAAGGSMKARNKHVARGKMLARE